MFHISKLPLCSSILFSSLHPFLDHKHILPISATLSSRPILIHVAVYTCAFSVKVVKNFFLPVAHKLFISVNMPDGHTL